MSRILLLASVVFVCGCGKDKGSESDSRPEPKASDAVAELLTKSREELAGLEKECAEKIRLEVKDFEEDTRVRRWDGLRFPLVAPIWQEASYSKKAGFSLPKYLAPGTKDNALAWHLARHGDLEAAQRLAERGEANKLATLHRELYKRNYPLEWTRLLARKIQLEQLRLRRGEEDAREDLLALHSQLRQVLDARAMKSPLGALLLPMGRRALRFAQGAQEKATATEKVSRLKEALAFWGEVPPPSPAVLPGMSRLLLERLWNSKSRGTILVATDVSRALDSLALLLPADQAETAVACFDKHHRLLEIAILYKPKVNLRYPVPADLAHDLEDHELPATRSDETIGVLRNVYSLGSRKCEVLICSTNGKLGGLVRWHVGKAAEARELQRAFGVAHLDASFEQNRLRCAPKQLGDALSFSDPAVLSGFRLPAGKARLVEGLLEREKGSLASRRLLLRVDADAPASQVLTCCLPPGRGFGAIAGEEGGEGRYLSFVWEDDRTRSTLRLPDASRHAFEFEARDRAPQDRAKRTRQATDFDRARRKERLAAGKPWRVLPRSLLLNGVKLGMTPAQVEDYMPRAEKMAFGLRQVFSPRTGRRQGFLARQLLVRFEAGRAAEIRLLLLETHAQHQPGLAASLREKYGATAKRTSRWGRAWQGLSERVADASLHSWQDDLTFMTYERLGGVAEWIVRDRPAGQEGPALTAPLNYCPRGVAGCSLGMNRADILRDWKGTSARQKPGAPLTLFPPGKSEYDAVLVWFKDGKAVRIVARHVAPNDARFRAAGMARALDAAWGEILSTVGCWSQRLVGTGGTTAALGWLDDSTRLRIFWQDDDGILRVFSEWVDAPG